MSTNKKNILFISFWNATKENPNNGIFIRRHAESLYKKGFQIQFLAINIHPGNTILSAQVSNVKEKYWTVTEFNCTSFFWKFIYTLYPLLLLLIKRYVFSHLHKAEHSLVISNVAHPAGVIGDFISNRLKIPHIIIEHFSKTRFLLTHIVFGKTLRRVYKNAHAVISVSNYLNEIIKEFIDHDKFYIVPNVVDSNTYNYKPITIEPENTARFISIGNWNQNKKIVKRPDLIINALGQVQSELPNIKLEIEFIGDGNMIPDMKKLCSKNHISTTFSGTRDSFYIASQLQKSSFFLHASNIETFSVVIVEALSCGVPVVASDVGAIPELINDKNGMLVDNNVDAWKNGIIRILKNEYDASYISESIRGKYDYNAVGQLIENIILNLN